MIGSSRIFQNTLELAKRVAGSNANIIISGESGTGKEVLARFIHHHSERKDGPFVAINCSAIPEALLESELFGHAKGSFTGAHDHKTGLFEVATDGTLFLDEIGDLNQPLQAKLLRVLQERQIRRVGENHYRSINCRIISATHKDLITEVKSNRFREDLFFRLNVVSIIIPPLRNRPEDIEPLAQHFLKKYAEQNSCQIEGFSEDAIQYLLAQPWLGNVRELENNIERAVILSEGPTIRAKDLQTTPIDSNGSSHDDVHWEQHRFVVDCADHLPPLDEVISKFVKFAVEHMGGARDKTAKALGVDRKTVYKRLKALE